MAIQTANQTIQANSNYGSITAATIRFVSGVLAWFIAPGIIKMALPAKVGDGVTLTMGADDFLALVVY